MISIGCFGSSTHYRTIALTQLSPWCGRVSVMHPRNEARHRRLFLRQMAELQRRHPCPVDHDAEPRGPGDPAPDPDTNGHRVGARSADQKGFQGCYPESAVAAVFQEITEP